MTRKPEFEYEHYTESNYLKHGILILPELPTDHIFQVFEYKEEKVKWEYRLQCARRSRKVGKINTLLCETKNRWKTFRFQPIFRIKCQIKET